MYKCHAKQYIYIYISAVMLSTYPALLVVIKAINVNFLIIPRPTNRCMVVSNWSFVLFLSEWMADGHIF